MIKSNVGRLGIDWGRWLRAVSHIIRGWPSCTWIPFSSCQFRFYHFLRVHASVHVSWTLLVRKGAAILCIAKASVEWAWTQVHWLVHWRTGSRTHDWSLSSRSFLSPGVGSGHICNLEENQIWEVKKKDWKMSKALNLDYLENIRSLHWRKVVSFI